MCFNVMLQNPFGCQVIFNPGVLTERSPAAANGSVLWSDFAELIPKVGGFVEMLPLRCAETLSSESSVAWKTKPPSIKYGKHEYSYVYNWN